MADYGSLANMAGSQFGISPNYLLTSLKMEGAPNNLFGFRGDTATAYGFTQQSDFGDATKQFMGAGALARDNARDLGGRLGRAPTDFELYVAHWQGAQGAFNIFSNPNATAGSTISNYFNNGGSVLPTGATNSDWLTLAKGRWMDAGGSLTNAERTGFMESAPNLPGLGGAGIDFGQAMKLGGGVIDQSAVTAPSSSGGAGWSDWILHQALRAGIFVMGMSFITAALLIFVLGSIKIPIKVFGGGGQATND